MHNLTHIFQRWLRRQTVVFVGLTLAWLLWPAPSAQAQGVNLVGACPTACNIKLRVLDAKLLDGPNGIDAVIEWSLDSIAPEIQLSGFRVTANIEFKNRSKDETTINVGRNERKATVRLTQSGKNKDIKFNDVTALRATVSAIADAPANVQVTNITQRSIRGEGNDSAVQVSWGNPGPLPCSATTIEVNVSAINEKNDRLTGQAFVDLNVRSAKVDLKGAVNKKGLHDPGAIILVKSVGIECTAARNFTPAQVPIGPGTGSNVTNPAVTVKPISFQLEGDRVSTTIPWDVIEPTGLRATRFDIKIDTELNDGRILTNTKSANGTARSVDGGQARVSDLRSVTATINATFANAANTTIRNVQDTRTEKFSVKAATLDTKKPVPPQGQAPNLGLSAEVANIVSENNAHTFTVRFQVKPASGVTITSFAIEATAQGNQNTATRNATVSGKLANTGFQFPFSEVGQKLFKVQVKVTATAQRADGSTFQQIATAEGQPVVPPPPPPPPVLLKVKTLNSIGGGNNFFVQGSWFIELQPGITVQGFIVEAAILKPTGPIRKTVNVGSDIRDQSVAFTTAEASGATAVEMKVIANLRRADGTTFQETATRQAAP